MNVLSGICRGGPKDGQSLATTSGRRVTHPGDPNGFYIHQPASGTTPAQWQWVATNRKEKI